jgi:electron-transferring-flavoprotein dehydrogenase
VSVGFVVSLGYRNPHLAPFAEFQRFKHHPVVADVLRGGRRVAYGARAVTKGGLMSLPELVFPGGLLVGCDAGLLNGAKIKGTHTAMQSGLLAAEALFEALAAGDTGGHVLDGYPERVRRSWLWSELRAARNFSAGFSRFGRLRGAALAFVEQNVLRGRAPWTLRDPEPDRAKLRPAAACRRIDYPRPDGVLSFDRLSSVHLANVRHDEDQPSHLLLADPKAPIDKNLPRFDEPAQRYCPAAVYEVVAEPTGPRFHINATNCIHCKACDIKDPAGNITWVPPEGGSGPAYSQM